MKFLNLVFLFLLTTPAMGQILVDTVSSGGGLNLGPTLSFSKVEYEDENDNIFEVKRKTIGLGITYGVSSDVNILFQFGHTFKSEIEDYKLKGDGYMLGTGVGFNFYNRGRLGFAGYGLLNYVDDTYKKKKNKVEMDVTDIHLGCLLVVRVNRVVNFFGGFDMVPYSDGSFKPSDISVERDDFLNLKLGMDFTLPSVNIKPEVTLIGEKTFAVSANFNI